MIEPWAYGTAVRATRFPTYWDYNTLRLEGRPTADLTAAALAEEADRLQADLAHRKIEIEDAGVGAVLAPGFEALGWHVERLVWMLHEGGSPGGTGSGIAEVPGDAAHALAAEWLAEDDMGSAEEIERQVAAHAAVTDLLPGRAVTLMAGDDGYCVLRIDGDEAEVEDVYVTPSARGCGLGTALTSAAIGWARAAGARDVWIGADDRGRPKHLYARLGFRGVWVRHEAVRRPV